MNFLSTKKNKLILLGVLVVVLLSFSYFENNNPFVKHSVSEIEKREEAEMNKDQMTRQEKATPTEIEQIEKSEGDDNRISPTPTLTQKPASTILDRFIYPGTVLEKNENQVTIESNDDPDVITDWYKSKIEAEGMSAKTTVRTNTNGNIENKLAGNNGEIEIMVEITRSSGDTVTRIETKIL